MVIVAVIGVLSQATVNYIIDRRWQRAQDVVNDKPIEVACLKKNKFKFKVRTWGDLRVGDIIKLYPNQEIPADVLILDIQGSRCDKQTCYVRGEIFNATGEMILKQSYGGTSNKTGFHISDDKFISSISGNLKWDYNHFGFFSGQFKQENSATAFNISSDNILMRGCFFNQA